MDVARDAPAGGAAASPAGDSRYAVKRRASAQARAAAADAAASFRAAGLDRPAEPPPARPSVAQFMNDLRAAFSARFHLLELEAKRAAWSAAYMLAFAVGAALLGVTAWLILIGALIYGAVAVGVPWVLAAAVAIVLHAVGAFLLVRAIRDMVDNLTFAATRRTLAKENSAQAPDGRRI